MSLMHEVSKARALMQQCVASGEVDLSLEERHLKIMQAYKFLNLLSENNITVPFGIAQSAENTFEVFLFVSHVKKGYNSNIDLYAFDVELTKLRTLSSQQAIGNISIVFIPE